jgi:hypothetical protein
MLFGRSLEEKSILTFLHMNQSYLHNIFSQIYPHSLETEFNNFQDNIRTFYFRRGKMETSDEDDENSIVGEFKASLHARHLYDCQKNILVLLSSVYWELFSIAS